jgi:hypothetical protein
MFRLSAMIYVLAATVLAGVAVTALLSMNMYERWQLAGGAAAGAVIAIPVAWLIGKHIYEAIGGRT